MSKFSLNKPLLILLYGFPGAGKTHFARQLSDTVSAAHIQADRIRHELFEAPRYDKREDEIVAHIMDYMTEVMLQAGVSVVYDGPVMRLARRRILRDLARRAHAGTIMIWLQIDHDSAFARVHKRDKRKADDKYAADLTRAHFDSLLAGMQNPKNEDYFVISGKHAFSSQCSTVIKKLYEHGYINADAALNKVVKPGLVNLIPNPLAGRVDPTRRNIVIR